MPTRSYSFTGLGEDVNSSARTPRVSLNMALGEHERPTAISFSGYLGNSNHDSDRVQRLAICDTSGNNAHGLKSVSIGHATQAGSTWVTGTVDASRANTSASPENAWTDLRGKSLALRKLSGDDTSVGIYGNVKVTVTTSIHELTWSKPNLEFTQNEYSLTVTRLGSVSDNWGGEITYYLLMDNVYVGDFSGDTLTITLTDADLEKAHHFSLMASGSESGSTVRLFGWGEIFTPASVHKTVSYYDGSTWVECVPYYYTGTEWQEVWPYYWDGTKWVLCSRT